jgi:alkylated DNA nucleotide flippase Atl1
MPKKTFSEKLNHSGDLPKVVTLTNPRLIERYKTTTMAIAAPLDYDALMKKVPKGKLTTIDRMMAHFAKKYKAGCACPMTAGIFVNIAAYASEERCIQDRLDKDETPWWRILKKDGQLNEKYPDGVEGQKVRLEAEGHRVVQKGKKYFVEGYEGKVWEIKA